MDEPVVEKDTSTGGPLETKYYCKLDKTTMNMNVVMELIPAMKDRVDRLPLRYVLLIDVSGSMGEEIGQHKGTLLQRVKMFAELAIRKVDKNDWLSIVTFSDEGVINMSMHQMLQHNKQIARNTIQSLWPQAQTNLESGLLRALEAIEGAPKTHRPCRDCIILFTDGAANLGDTNAASLIATYNNIQRKMKRRSCIPVSALTIGGYHPDLLIEISRNLSSDSFYWLNDEEDFEADMLMPLFIREVTNISDVQIAINAKTNCYFDPVDRRAENFTGDFVTKIKIKHKKKSKKIKAPTTQTYFIHALPDKKHITFNLQVSELQDLNNERVVEVVVQYLDCDMYSQTIKDYIQLSTSSLKSTILRDPNAGNVTISAEGQLTQIAAYIVLGNFAGISWNYAQEAITKIAEEEYRRTTITGLAGAKVQLEENPAKAQGYFEQACVEMNNIRFAASSILPEGGQGAAVIESLYEEWTKRIIDAQDMVSTNDDRNFSILSCMESCINAESPIGGGVFLGKQPFMNDTLDMKLEEEKMNLEAIRRLHSRGNIDLNDVKNSAERAIAIGDLENMESCYEDLKAVKLFSYVDEGYMKHVANEIEHRRELETTKKDLEVAVRNEDLASATAALTQLDELGKSRNLTFTNGDGEAVKRGHGAVDEMRLKRSMRGEIAKQMSVLNATTQLKNLTAIANAIHQLTLLKSQSANYSDVFTKQHEIELNLHIAKHQVDFSRIQELKTKMESAVSILNFPRKPANYDAINSAIHEMETIKFELEHNFAGMFTENEEKALNYGIKSRQILTALKENIQQRLDVVLPVLELPMIPRNYADLKDAVEEGSSLKERANGFKDVFSEENDVTLTKASANLATLMTKRDEYIEKLSIYIPLAGLPKLPNNYNKIKVAVETLTVVKQEANGFENVFTQEHDEILQRGTASLKILQAEKDEVEREEGECVPQLQLPMISNNFTQISKGVDTMQRITPDLKGFGMYKEEYDGMINQAIFNRDVLHEKKQQIMNEIQMLKVDLKVPLTPENIPTLSIAIDKMKMLKKEAEGYGNVFTSANEADLFQALSDLEQLTKNADKTTKARHRLEEAMEAKNFIRLTHAVKKASRAPFIKNEELLDARKLVVFLDPENRCAAVENAIEDEDIEAIEEALLDLKEAAVDNVALEQTAKRMIHRLRKRKRREERQIRRAERAAAKRRKALDKLNTALSDATAARDLESLQNAVNNLDISDFTDEEVTAAADAREVLKELKIERMRERLKEGIKTRVAETLYNALMDAKYGRYEEHMKEEYAEAEALLTHILEMMRLREEIAKMSRATISEVHSYGAPPEVVKKVMKAMFIILGESSKKLTWMKIQGLLGKLDRNSMTNRVKRFRVQDLLPESASKAATLMEDLELEEVETVSKVAATLFAWAKYVVKEVEHIQEQQKKRGSADEETAADYQYDSEEFDGEHDVDEGENMNEPNEAANESDEIEPADDSISKIEAAPQETGSDGENPVESDKEDSINVEEAD